MRPRSLRRVTRQKPGLELGDGRHMCASDSARYPFLAPVADPSPEREQMPLITSPNGPHVRYSHASADRRSGLNNVHQDKARPAATVEHAAAAQGTADHRQAQYFIRMLRQSREVIDQRIGKYQRVTAGSQAGDDVETARSVRRKLAVEEKDRQVLSEMIENLERRFLLRSSGPVPHISRRARPAVR